ncbi:Cpap3-d2 [Cordylochernes scorpioides]|uniref:Cpap3-d2 n=1 Tax=Cordylochernes scorpioides TaxID=51811 RepID=A0ABY6K3I8_9ARAC|nr:Cpap3-d2 [Cordylochernes scorpioides]
MFDDNVEEFVEKNLVFRRASAQCGPQAGYYSDPRQCDLYYECHNGTFIERLCPDGLVFDDRHVNQARCDFPHNVDCGSRNLMQAPQPSGNCPRKWGMFPHEQDCGHYWNCIEGRAHLISCPEGLAYSEVWSVCDWPDRVPSCDSEVYLGVQCPDPGQSDLQHYTMSHPSDCRRHYICVLRPEDKRYLPRLMSCEEGRVFNSYTLSCDLPENVPGW